LAFISFGLSTWAILKVGLSTLFRSREAAAAAFGDVGGNTAASGLFRAVTTIPVALVAYLLILGRSHRYGLSRLAHRMLTAVALTLTAVVANPLANPRFTAGSVGIALLVAIVRPMRPLAVRGTMLAIALGVLLIFPVADQFRRDQRSSESLRFDRELFLGGDYDSFQQSMNTIRYVSQEGLLAGDQLLGVATVWVPRQLWDSKPRPGSLIVSEHQGYPFTNLSNLAWMDGYLDFGLLGLAGCALALGAIAGRVERSGLQSLRSPLGSLAPFFAGYQVVLLRGSLMAVLVPLAVWLGALAAVTSGSGCNVSVGTETTRLRTSTVSGGVPGNH
jgi:hypothetical protein